MNLLQDTSKPVQMMKQTSHFNFVSLEDVQAKILEIPYKGGELSMLVLLPSEVDGLQEVRPGLYRAARRCLRCWWRSAVRAAHSMVAVIGRAQAHDGNVKSVC